ncbi:S8 family peptidase [Streptosporangium amethystogenes]|uniref:S8 family peptidase n=1 Tax=Streptosporangium amethystogenes TaxID=2002 RepID=UPI0037AF8B90
MQISNKYTSFIKISPCPLEEQLRLSSLLIGVITLATTAAALSVTSAVADPVSKIAPDITVNGEYRVIVQLQQPSQVRSALASAELVNKDKKNVYADPPAEVADHLNFFVYRGSRAELEEIAKQAGVVSIREDKLNEPSLIESIPLIGADKAHQRHVTGKGTAVAILDTGIDNDHPAFAERIMAQACFSATDLADNATSLCPNGSQFQIGDGAANAETEACMEGASQPERGLCYHGTHVAGIAAGQATKEFPAAGVAPKAKIIPVQVFSRFTDSPYCGVHPFCVKAYESSILTGMVYVNLLAKQYNIAAVNLSLGGSRYETVCDEGDGKDFKAQVEKLIANGTATVVASSNYGFDDAVSWPACVSNTVAVGATNNQDAVATFSNRGPLIDLLAPGAAIKAAIVGNTYAYLGGTSMAAPHVAGTFALLHQKHKHSSVDELLDALKRTGKPITYISAGTQVTTPRINVLTALHAKH